MTRMKYRIIKKANLFVQREINDVCDWYDLTRYSGIVLAKREDEIYVVFASLGCNPIVSYNCGDIVKPPISEDIIEKFDNYEDAYRMYEYLENIASKIPLFKPSMKVGAWVSARQNVGNTKKVICKTLVDFMSGVSLTYHLSYGKDNHKGYHIFLNDVSTYSLDNKEDFEKILEELTTYIKSLPKIRIREKDLPSWFSLSNKNLWSIMNTLYAFSENEYCTKILFDKTKPEFHLILDNEISYFNVKIRGPERNAAHWGENMFCYLEVSNDFTPFINNPQRYKNDERNRYEYHIKNISYLDLDTITTKINEIFMADI